MLFLPSQSTEWGQLLGGAELEGDVPGDQPAADDPGHQHARAREARGDQGGPHAQGEQRLIQLMSLLMNAYGF